jgi:hypothetical protein
MVQAVESKAEHVVAPGLWPSLVELQLDHVYCGGVRGIGQGGAEAPWVFGLRPNKSRLINPHNTLDALHTGTTNAILLGAPQAVLMPFPTSIFLVKGNTHPLGLPLLLRLLRNAA